MKISILLLTYKRREVFEETLENLINIKYPLIEILILDNNENDSLRKYVETINTKSNIDFRYFNDGNNYGVSNGRNYLINKAKGDILITLDDDIFVESPDEMIYKTIEYFKNNNEIGCLAYNIIDFKTKTKEIYKMPHHNKNLNYNENFFTYTFSGAGHAIKKEVYIKSGIYPSDFGLYGGEEYDLSLRILDSNYKILYTADIIIYHKHDLNGRLINEKALYNNFINKLKTHSKYLPFIYSITLAFIWYAFYILKTRKILSVSKIFKIFINSYKNDRKKLKKSTLKYLKQLDARLLY